MYGLAPQEFRNGKNHRKKEIQKGFTKAVKLNNGQDLGRHRGVPRSILGLICLHNRVRQFLTINLFMLIERTLINTMYTSLCKCSVTVRATGERILSDALRQHLRVQTNTVASYNSQQKKLRASLTLQSLYFLKFRKGTCIKSVQNTLCSLV